MYLNLIKEFGAKNSVRLFDCALSNAVGKKQFQHVISSPGYSGFKKRTYESPNEEVQQITVKTDLLDNIVPKEIEIEFVKIDVEGAELEVLQGAKETITRCKPVIIFEHGLGAADHYGTTPEKMYELIVDQFGLRMFRLGDWLVSKGEKSLNKTQLCELFYSGSEFYFLAAR